MDTHVIFGILAGAISGAGAVPYIISVIKKKTKPHPVTWWLWAVLGIITLITYRASGGSETIWRAIVNFVSPLIIAILSIKYWDGKILKFDWWCFFLSVLSLVVWLVSGNPVLGLAVSLLADTFAALPTYRKLWNAPQSESMLSWGINSVGNICNVLAIRTWMFGIALLPVYLLALSLSLTVLCLRRFTNSKNMGPIKSV